MEKLKLFCKKYEEINHQFTAFTFIEQVELVREASTRENKNKYISDGALDDLVQEKFYTEGRKSKLTSRH